MGPMKIVRSIAGSSLCAVAAVCMRSWRGHLPWPLWIPTVLLGLAAILTFHRASASQILARAILWSNLLLAAVIVCVGDGRDQSVAAVLSVATVGALVVLWRQGLDEQRGAFAPVAFRATLIALLVMALSDAQTLLFWGTVFLDDRAANDLLGAGTTGALALACGIAFSIGVAGLYRLRVWGLVVNSLAGVFLGVLVACGVFHEMRAFQYLFAGSAILQIAFAVPLYAALMRGRRNAAPAAARSTCEASG